MNLDLSPENLFSLICAIPALVMGLTVHEFAHAWAADRLGDPTPRREGRLTLDPLMHIDPFGALFFVFSWLSGFGMGWAKPVMTNPRNLKHPHRDSLLIAIAGPVSNLLQTPIWLAALFAYGYFSPKMHFVPGLSTGLGQGFFDLVRNGVVINIGLAAFNMVPIPPLDGHWVLGALAGESVRNLFDAIRPYSFMILLVLINYPNPSLFDYILGPVYQFAYALAHNVFFAGFQLGMR